MALHFMTRRKIRRLFTGKLPPTERADVLKAVAGCPACAEYYNKHQALESALSGTDEPFTVFSIERTKEALFATLDKKALSKGGFYGLRGVLAPTAVATVAALLAFVILLPAGPAPDRTSMPSSAVVSPVTLVARGSFPKKADSDVGIRLFRVSDDGKSVTEGGDLSIDDIITFTYTHANEPGGRLALFGIQETGELRWYYPGYKEKMSIAIEGDKVDEPLKDGIALHVNHRPGWLRITALFTQNPLSAEEIEASTAVLRKDPKRIRALTPITLEKSSTPPLQYSVMVNIGGRR